MHQDATWYGDRPQPTGLCVTWGPCPLPEKEAEPGGEAPHFSAHVSCGQTAAIAACMKMELGMEVSLGPVRIALDEDTAPLPQKGGRAPPNFRPIFIVAKWLDGSRCHLARR